MWREAWCVRRGACGAWRGACGAWRGACVARGVVRVWRVACGVWRVACGAWRDMFCEAGEVSSCGCTWYDTFVVSLTGDAASAMA